MTSVRGLSNLYCGTCRDTWIHEAGVCRRCGTPNKASGNPPVPRTPRVYGYSTVKNYSAAHIEQHQARKRAALARHQHLRARGHT